LIQPTDPVTPSIVKPIAALATSRASLSNTVFAILKGAFIRAEENEIAFDSVASLRTSSNADITPSSVSKIPAPSSISSQIVSLSRSCALLPSLEANLFKLDKVLIPLYPGLYGEKIPNAPAPAGNGIPL